MKKLMHSVIILLSCIQFVVAQDVSLPPNTAATIKASGASNRGVPSISLPLFEVSSGDIKLPITLDYYAGGIKVKEVASSVGLGWSLNTGGSIVRSVRGRADDYSKKYGFMYNDFIPHEAVNEKRFLRALYGASYREIFQYDFAPDVYSFNFLGYSGKFIYNKKTKKFIQYPGSLLKIIPSFSRKGRIYGWKIITPEGITCFFGGGYEYDFFDTDNKASRIFDTNSIKLYNYPRHTVNNDFASWYITKIIDANGNTISFNYQKNGAWIEPEDNRFFSGAAWRFETFQKDRILKKYNYSMTKRQAFFLESIKFSNGRLEFRLSDTTREDATQLKKLESVVLFDKFDTPIKAYEFDYTYFKGKMSARINEIKSKYNTWFTKEKKTIKEKPSFSMSFDEITKRLALKNISQKDYLSNKETNLFSFEYYDKYVLPDRFSYAQDYWGFYNGIDNRILVPKVRKRHNNTWVVLGEANRSVQIEKAKACSLKKITYGSGGFKEFFYESNTGSVFKNEKNHGWESVYDNILDPKTPKNIGGLRIAKIITNDGNNTTSVVTYKYNFFNTTKSSGCYASYLPVKIFNESDKPSRSTISSRVTKNHLINRDFASYKNITELVDNGKKGKIEYTYNYNPYKYKFKYTKRHSYSISGKTGTTTYDIGAVPERGKDSEYSELDLDWRIGSLKKTVTYGVEKGKFIKKSEDVFNYETSNTRRIDHLGFSFLKTELSLPAYHKKKKDIILRFYDFMTENHRLKSKKSTFFLESGTKSKTVTTNHFYERHPLKASKIITIDGDKTYTTKLFYPEDVNRLGYNPIGATEKNQIKKLIQRNRTAEVIQTEKKVQNSAGKVVATTATRTLFYEPHTKIVVPKEAQVIKGDFSSNNTLKTKVNYHKYDAKGKAIEVSNNKGVHTVTMYGYNDQLVIATIVNATYEQVKPYEDNLKQLSNQDNDNCIASSCKEQALRNALNALRNALPNAMVTTYTYKPLVGKTSETNANGVTTYFTYDAFNRLQSKRDHNYNIITDYVYRQKK